MIILGYNIACLKKKEKKKKWRQTPYPLCRTRKLAKLLL